jgi:hypothetical protein
MNAGIDTGFETVTPAPTPGNGTAGIAPHVIQNDITGQ